MKKETSKVTVKLLENLNDSQEKAIKLLQHLAFPGVSDEEANEDFYHLESAHVLAYLGQNLVGWAGIHKAKPEFEGIKIKLGGYGICTHPDYRRLGIASEMSQTAQNYLTRQGCEIAFLSVDPANLASVKLHQKNGFRMLPGKFSWTNSKGELRYGEGGMVAPLKSQTLFKQVLKSKETFHVGNGYW